MVTLAVPPASAWNIPGHMLSGIIAYQVLQRENPQTIDKINAVLEKHPWYANQWQAKLQDVSNTDRDLVLFMQVARWPSMIFTLRTSGCLQKRMLQRDNITPELFSIPHI